MAVEATYDNMGRVEVSLRHNSEDNFQTDTQEDFTSLLLETDARGHLYDPGYSKRKPEAHKRRKSGGRMKTGVVLHAHCSTV